LDARLETPIRLREQPLGPDAARGIGPRNAVRSGKVLPPRRDDEIAALLLHIGRTAGIALHLVVAEAASTRLKRPLRGIGSGAVRAVELVAPQQLPLRRLPVRRIGCRGMRFSHSCAD